MTDSEMSYTPFRIPDSDTWEIGAQDYLRFIASSVHRPSLRMIHQRAQLNPEFVFLNTKFNPNTGEELSSTRYDTLYLWLVGRGSEACSEYLRAIEFLPQLYDLRDELRPLLQRYVASHNDAILRAVENNSGRCPFRVDRALREIDADGKRVQDPSPYYNAADLFCAKALIADGRDSHVEIGSEMFRKFVSAAFENRYADDTIGHDETIQPESPFMLSFGAFKYLMRNSSASSRRPEWAQMAADMLDFVLRHYYDESTETFAEYMEVTTGKRLRTLNPGHASELVGLALQAVDSIRRANVPLSSAVESTFQYATKELPHLLLRAFEVGYNYSGHGLNQAVDFETGEPLNNNLPWWNLPETMRAVARCISISGNRSLEERLRRIFRTASNDYFQYYLNPNKDLFPFRTRSGDTGEVIDLMPVVPEADPFYHTNVSLIDMEEVVGSIG